MGFLHLPFSIVTPRYQKLPTPLQSPRLSASSRVWARVEWPVSTLKHEWSSRADSCCPWRSPRLLRSARLLFQRHRIFYIVAAHEIHIQDDNWLRMGRKRVDKPNLPIFEVYISFEKKLIVSIEPIISRINAHCPKHCSWCWTPRTEIVRAESKAGDWQTWKEILTHN